MACLVVVITTSLFFDCLISSSETDNARIIREREIMQQENSTSQNKLADRLLWLADKHAGGKHTIFAKNADIPASTFQGYLQGRAPHPDHLLRIRETYGVSIDWILSGDGPIYLSEVGESKGNRRGAATDEDPAVAELLEGARRVLKSGNPIAFDALERNIRYFDHAVASEKRLQAVEAQLEKVMRVLSERKGPRQKAANDE